MNIKLLVTLFSISKVLTESIYKAYIINIPFRTNRLESITTQLNNQSIPYEVFPAITPADIEAERILRIRRKSTGRFYPETRMNFRFRIRHGPRPSEIGCMQSHLQILLKMAKSGSNQPFLILEDDALLDPDFYQHTVDLMQRIKSKWDILHVGYCLEPPNMCDPNGESGPDYCKMKKQILFCLHAYFVNGANSARDIASYINTPYPGTMDHVLGYSTDHYFISLPKLAKQVPFQSDNGNHIGHWQKLLTSSEMMELSTTLFEDYLLNESKEAEQQSDETERIQN